MFQFQGSLLWLWKQRRKESSTMAAAASCTSGLMSSRSRLFRRPDSHHCVHLACESCTSGLMSSRSRLFRRPQTVTATGALHAKITAR